MFTHAIVTTVRTRRRFWPRTTETVIAVEVEAYGAEELGRITRAVLTAISETLPHADVTSKPEPLPMPSAP
ncbi:hypothetical protein ACUXZZ_45445 (plasmid) [Streptomyces graminifolii]|uniref:hypothetical protein n=1 Tax=Streptomyces graminifolii TaxID=1266771 RepID=UPI0040585CA6